MKSFSWGAALAAAALLAGSFTSGCHPTFVVLPAPGDSLVDSAAVESRRPVRRPRPPIRVDTVLRVDTVVMAQADTVVRTDTVYRLTPPPPPTTLVDTVVRFDTVARVDTVTRVDTVIRVDTVLRVDTVRLVVPGKRLLFVPPGHYPPAGQCRIWIHGQPPGRQADPAPCASLPPVPGGAFVLFGGEAWDFDYDWIAEEARHPGTVPPEILALQRRRPQGLR